MNTNCYPCPRTTVTYVPGPYTLWGESIGRTSIGGGCCYQPIEFLGYLADDTIGIRGIWFLPHQVSGCAIGPTVHGVFPELGMMISAGGLPWFHLPVWGRSWL